MRDRLTARWLEAADDVQIRERTGHQQPMSILGQATIADLRESEDAFNHANDMFHFSPHPRLGPVLGPLDHIHDPLPPYATVREILGLGSDGANHRRLPLVRPIPPDSRLPAMQEAREDRAIRHMGRRGGRRMDELALAVDAHMGLHPEVPLLALGGLVHVWVTGLVGVLRRARGVDNRGIHNGAGGHAIAEGLEMLSDRLEERGPQLVCFQQMPEPADRGFVGNGFHAQVDPDEGAHGQRVVQGLFDRGIGEVKPLLQEVDPKHPFDSHGTSAGRLRLRVHRLNHRAQRLPWHHPIHFGEKHLTACRLAEALKASGRGQRRLFHRCLPP